jgi:hypothetical protein
MQKLRKFAQALEAGEWFERQKSTQVFADIAIGVGLVAAAGASVYGTVTQAGIAGQQLSLENSQNYRQGTAFNQLEALINNPSAFFGSPVYQAAFNQGTQAVSRAGAAAGTNNTSSAIPQGGMATALQTFGQSFGEQQLLSQEQLLAGMSGTSFNPASAGATASGAAQSATGSLNSLAGLLSFFGTSGIAGGAGGGGGNFGLTNAAAASGW